MIGCEVKCDAPYNPILFKGCLTLSLFPEDPDNGESAVANLNSIFLSELRNLPTNVVEYYSMSNHNLFK